MHYEVEQKFAVPDLAAVERKLHALGAQAAGAIDQVDQYFNHPARDFAQTDEALRLRSAGGRHVITYKGPKIDATTKTRREIELQLAGPIEQYAELLVALGFRPVAEVRKHRRVFQAPYQSHVIEAALDDVAGLGSFIELELSADESTLERARSAIAALGAELGLAHSERRSYLELLLESNR